MTEYNKVFAMFKDKITDPDLLLFTADIQSEILIGLLTSACARFNGKCIKDLTNRDDDLQTFHIELNDTEIDIITELMVEYWTKPHLNNIENLRNHLSTKDFSTFSSANLLNSIQELYKLSRKNARSYMNEYSMSNGDFEVLKP
jgi:hypothetical protein